MPRRAAPMCAARLVRVKARVIGLGLGLGLGLGSPCVLRTWLLNALHDGLHLNPARVVALLRLKIRRRYIELQLARVDHKHMHMHMHMHILCMRMWLELALLRLAVRAPQFGHLLVLQQQSARDRGERA